MRIAVILSTYNQPRWLRRALVGYECQDDDDFDIVIADDGSGEETRAVIDSFAQQGTLRLHHVWHEDDGFRKTTILNRAIARTDADYLLFSDGDCIPRRDMIALHRRQARPGSFLSAGYFKLPAGLSARIGDDEIRAGQAHSYRWLRAHGLSWSIKSQRLRFSSRTADWANRLTTTAANWNGMNSSGWRTDILAVNGFDERMRYGGEDREMGERLRNRGLDGIQIRYSAICVHLEHGRGYVNAADRRRNQEIHDETVRSGRSWTEFGIRPGPRTA